MELSHKSLNITSVKSLVGFIFMTQTKNLRESNSFCPVNIFLTEG